MTNAEFAQYKLTADKVIDLLIKEKHSSIKDIKILYNIIMGFPFCLDREGQYTYEGKYYNSLEELPDEAKRQLLYCTSHSLHCNTESQNKEVRTFIW